MALQQIDDRATALLREAAEWRLLGRLFESPMPQWRDDVSRLRHEVPAGPLRDCAGAAMTATEGQYHSVFGPGGPAPPREASYHASVELGSLMSAIEGEYEAFAYQPTLDEPADHVATEAGFVAYLRLKEVYAHLSGDEEAAGIAARVADRFIKEHLAVIAHPLADLLAESDITYLATASRLLAGRVGPRPKTRQLPVFQPDRALDDEGGEFSCEL